MSEEVASSLEAQIDAFDEPEVSQGISADVVGLAPPVGEAECGDTAIDLDDTVLVLAEGEGVCCVCDQTFEDKLAASTGLTFSYSRDFEAFNFF